MLCRVFVFKLPLTTLGNLHYAVKCKHFHAHFTKLNWKSLIKEICNTNFTIFLNIWDKTTFKILFLLIFSAWKLLEYVKLTFTEIFQNVLIHFELSDIVQTFKSAGPGSTKSGDAGFETGPQLFKLRFYWQFSRWICGWSLHSPDTNNLENK